MTVRGTTTNQKSESVNGGEINWQECTASFFAKSNCENCFAKAVRLDAHLPSGSLGSRRIIPRRQPVIFRHTLPDSATLAAVLSKTIPTTLRFNLNNRSNQPDLTNRTNQYVSYNR